MSNVQPHIDLLGNHARDRVTGFAGVITSVSFDLYGCIQAVLTPCVDKEGKPVDGRWFDVNRLDVDDQPRVMPVPTYSAAPQLHAHGPAEKPAP